MGMPDETDLEGLRTTGYWRVFQGFPIVFCIIALILLTFVVKHEPPKYLIANNEDQRALESIKASYHRDEDCLEILAYLKKNISVESDKMTYS